MKTKINKLDLISGVSEIAGEDLICINGGGFAYDFGFFLREMVVYISNGGGITGTSSAISDVSLNYKPAN